MSNNKVEEDFEVVEERVAALKKKAVDVDKVKHLLQEKLDAEIIKIENGAERIGKRTLKCRRTPLKD